MSNAQKLDYYRGNLVRQISDSRNILIESDQAVVVNDAYPKAQYHFQVVPKEDIENVTKLTEDHLPLLDHMLDLAHQIIEKKAKDLFSNFRIGFKMHAFMNRLNLHVISDDFHSFSMRRINHWNSFNTELFLPFQVVYMMLQMHGSIETMSLEEVEKLKNKKPLTCVHCEFSTNSLLELKGHLFTHWHKREAQREHKQRMGTLVHVLEAIKLEEHKFKAEQELKNNETEAAKKTKEQEEIFKAQQFHQPNKYYPNYQNQAHQGFNRNPNPNNPFRQQPHQFLQQRPNVWPSQNFNGENRQLHYPCGPPRQPHPNYPNHNQHQGRRYPNTVKTQPRNGQQSDQPKSNPDSEIQVKSNRTMGKPAPISYQKYQNPKCQQKKPTDQQHQQQSEQSKTNPKKKDEANPDDSKATAEATLSTATGKQHVKKKWPKTRQTTKTGKAQGVAAQSSGPQKKPANT